MTWSIEGSLFQRPIRDRPPEGTYVLKTFPASVPPTFSVHVFM